MNRKPWIPKLYIVSRADLKRGTQACQGMHAFREFIELHPETERNWYKNSNHIVFLEARNIKHLKKLIELAKNKNIKYATFFEPDLKNELTAAVFEPIIESRDMLKNLPLALNNK